VFIFIRQATQGIKISLKNVDQKNEFACHQSCHDSLALFEHASCLIRKLAMCVRVPSISDAKYNRWQLHVTVFLSHIHCQRIYLDLCLHRLLTN
jgi:hypothetical protein